MDLISKIIKEKQTVRGVLNNHLNEIRQILADGYTKKSIYEILKKENLLKCDYIYFLKILNPLLSEKTKQPKQNKPIATDSIKRGFVMPRLTKEEIG